MLRMLSTLLLLGTVGWEVSAGSLLGGLLGGSGSGPSPSPSPTASGAVQAGSAGATGSCLALPFNPWLLNVAVLGDLGTSGSARGGTVKGSIAVLGNAYASSLTVNAAHTHSPSSVALYVGGGLTYSGGQCASGGLEVAGNVALTSVTVAGDATIGGTLTGSGSCSITGNLLVAGTCALCQTITGLVSGLLTAATGTFTASLSLSRLLSYFNCIALSLGINVDTTTYALVGAQLTISLSAQATRNYVTIPAAVLAKASTVSIAGGLGLSQELVINVPDVNVTLSSAITFNYVNVNSTKVLLNLPNAVTLTIAGGFAANLLAPFATTSFTTGALTGSVIVKSLLGGSGQINDDIFVGLSLPSTCPGEACAGSAQVAPVSPVPTGCASLPFNPWLLNLAVLGDVGSAALGLSVSVKGAAAVLGNAWAAALNVNVGLHARCNSGTNLYVGGSLTCNGGQSNNGGIEVGGNVFLNSMTISGNVAVGGVLNGGSSGISIAGNVAVSGTCPLCTSLLGLLTGGVKLSVGVPFAPSLNLNRVQSYFQCITSWVRASADTTTYALSGTQLTIALNAQYARHFVTIPASALTSALTVAVSGTAGMNQELIINVPDVSVNITSAIAFSYVNVNSTNVLLNLPNAVNLAIGGSVAVNLLAPLANVTVAANVGALSGTFVVKALLGAAATFSDDIFCNIAFPMTCPYEACAETVPAVVSPPPAACPTLPFNPWLLNAVVLGDVGSATTALSNVAIKGAAAALGNVWATGLGLNVGLHARVSAGIDLYVGGSVTLNGGSSYAGGLEVAGNVALSGGVSVNGNVAIGGILNGGTGGASIAGNLNVAVACPLCSSLLGLLLGGFQQNVGTPFTPTLNLNRVQSYFQCTSSWVAGSSDTVAYTTSGSTLTINLGTLPIRHFVTIAASVLGVSLNVVINGGLGLNQELVINVPDVSVNLTAAIAFNYVNINSTKVLLNLPNAVSLTIGAGFTVNLLAPLAATLLNGGVTAGNLIVKQLLGGSSGGKINDDTYCAIAFPSTCPNEACSGSSTVASTGASPASPSPAGPPASPGSAGAASSSCAATLAPYAAQYSYFDVAGCTVTYIESVAAKYGCVLLGNCNAYFCSTPIPLALYTTLAQCILA